MATIDRTVLGRPFAPGGVVAIGWYDGVHRGHREALAHLRDVADREGRIAGLVLLDDDRPDRRLTTVEQRIELIQPLGLVDVVWVVRASFDEWSRRTPEFIRDVLTEATRAGAVLTTTGSGQGPEVEAFGNRITELSTSAGFEVVALDEAWRELDDLRARCSTAAVAQLLDVGDVAGAAELLGRPHAMRGRVEPGDQRGRTLGFPTANIGLPASFVIPKEAVYAGTLEADDGVERKAAISLGRRPTFYPDGLELLEAHVVDFEGDLYGQLVTVRFHQFLRDQRRFGGPGELVAQLQLDVAATRQLVTVP